MAITATLRSKEALPDGTVRIEVVTSDPPRGDTRHTLTLSPVEATTANIIARVNRLVFEGIAAAQAAVAALPAPGASVVLTPPGPPAEPSPAEVARAAWLADFEKLQKANRVVAAGITLTPANQQLFDNLKTTLDAGFLPAYVDFL